MATGPKIARDPIALLTPTIEIEEPYLNKVWGPSLLGSLAFVAVCFGNWATKRPMLSGLQKHAIAVAGGAFIGKYVEEVRRDYLAERDAVLRHYIQLHPEDFPTPEVKKYADILEPWYPIR